MNKLELEDAYRNTTFWVDHPSGDFGIRIGEACPQLDALLRENDLTTWAYVTAWNPQSKRLPDEVNAQRHANFLAYVCALKYPVFTGRGKPNSGDWVPEESLLILGIGEEAALRLGISLDQYALVIGKAGGPAELNAVEYPGYLGSNYTSPPLTKPLPDAQELQDLESYAAHHAEEIIIYGPSEGTGTWLKRDDVPKKFDPDDARLLEGKVSEARLAKLARGARPNPQELKLWKRLWVIYALEERACDIAPGYAIREIGRRNFALITVTGGFGGDVFYQHEGLFVSEDRARDYMRAQGWICQYGESLDENKIEGI